MSGTTKYTRTKGLEIIDTGIASVEAEIGHYQELKQAFDVAKSVLEDVPRATISVRLINKFNTGLEWRHVNVAFCPNCETEQIYPTHQPPKFCAACGSFVAGFDKEEKEGEWRRMIAQKEWAENLTKSIMSKG